MPKRAKDQASEQKHVCSVCKTVVNAKGEHERFGEMIHDFSDGAPETVVLTVRKNNKYQFIIGAGERVRVEKKVLESRNLMTTFITDAEILEIEAERKRKAEEAARRPDRSVGAMVAAGLAELAKTPRQASPR